MKSEQGTVMILTKRSGTELSSWIRGRPDRSQEQGTKQRPYLRRRGRSFGRWACRQSLLCEDGTRTGRSGVRATRRASASSSGSLRTGIREAPTGDNRTPRGCPENKWNSHWKLGKNGSCFISKKLYLNNNKFGIMAAPLAYKVRLGNDIAPNWNSEMNF